MFIFWSFVQNTNVRGIILGSSMNAALTFGTGWQNLRHDTPGWDDHRVLQCLVSKSWDDHEKTTTLKA